MRGYYGTFSHNAKSVYQRYLGWYDANPANLNPLPPVERAKKTVAYMGGAEAAIARAREDFAKGEYRWVADAMSQVVFAEPDNRAARELGADALEQLGYQSESATWRNAYLQGARELRGGVLRTDRPLARGRRHRARPLARPVLRFPRRAPQRRRRPKARPSSSTGSSPTPASATPSPCRTARSPTWPTATRQSADCTVTLDRTTLNRVILRELTLPEALAQGLVKIAGNGPKVAELFALLDDFTMGFEVVEPLRNIPLSPLISGERVGVRGSHKLQSK